MKLIILLFFLGMIMPAFAQESPLNETSNQLENQDSLKKLENKISDIENKVEQTISKINGTENQNLEFNQRLEKLENTNNSLENINTALKNTNTSLENIKESVDDSNYTNLVLIAISLFVAAGSMLFAGAQGYHLRKQTTLAEKEQKLRLRPILVRREYFDFKDGLKRPHKVQKDKILFRITNKGSLATTKVLMRWYVAIIQNNKLEFIRSSDEDYPTEGRLLPNLEIEESYSIDLFINNTHYTHIHKKTNCIFGIILEYFDENNGKYEYRMDGYFDHGGDLMLLSQEEMQKMKSLMINDAGSA